MDETPISKMKVPDLKHELQKRGLETKGLKAELVARYKAAIAAEEAEAAAEAPPTEDPEAEVVIDQPEATPEKASEAPAAEETDEVAADEPAVQPIEESVDEVKMEEVQEGTPQEKKRKEPESEEAVVAEEADAATGDAVTATPSEEAGLVKLFVGGLGRDLKEQELRKLFEEHGEVKKLDLAKDNKTLKPRGYAFVIMPKEAADKAMEALHEKHQCAGAPSKMKVLVATKKGGAASGSRLFVYNIPKTATEEEIKKVFEAHGKVSEVRSLGETRQAMISEYGESRALVEMGTVEIAKAATEALNGKVKMPGSKVFLGVKTSGMARGRLEDGNAAKKAKLTPPAVKVGGDAKGGKGKGGKGGRGSFVQATPAMGKGTSQATKGGKGKGGSSKGAGAKGKSPFMGQMPRAMQQPMVYVPMMPNLASPLPMMMPQAMMQPQMLAQQQMRMPQQQIRNVAMPRGVKKTGLNYGPMDMSLPGSRGFQWIP
ncbi:hypothetical protein CYMTET_11509 [Cymbomonas tetramitiformis]|uniref:Uncharacterized protein n=1 Tax=Cymbomonas tetramitiformis TaxID=36881 RepID=A0AAE0GM69_9CHLO|nr:hypothetical protein CYMTET_11509 [Cymbomonas tetramitiformis]